MAEKELPSPELLRKLLRYEPDTGKLFWRERTPDMFSSDRICRSWNSRWAGQEAGTMSNQSISIDVNAQKMRAHRVAWAVFYGEWPKQVIDHINGNPFDNTIKNLRDASPCENQRNQGGRKNNTSGHVGIRMCSRPAKWRAEIKVNGKMRHLGYYDDLSEAIAAREKAKSQNGFTKRHGL